MDKGEGMGDRPGPTETGSAGLGLFVNYFQDCRIQHTVYEKKEGCDNVPE
jgi:hypothetical protein